MERLLLGMVVLCLQWKEEAMLSKAHLSPEAENPEAGRKKLDNKKIKVGLFFSKESGFGK